MKLRSTLFFIGLFFSFVVHSQCTMANYMSAIRIPIASYPYAATSAAVTVSATTVGVPTLANSSYSCGTNLYGGASPAWWLNGATQTISIVFSQPVRSLTFLINGTNSTEEFYIISNSTCPLSISNLCTIGFSSVGGTVIAGPTAALGSIITVNNPAGSTQYRMTHNGLGAGSRVTLLDCFVIGTGTCILPIELMSFSGKCNNNIVDLEWETISEKDNDFFTVERSENTFDWQEIGTVRGSGNSASSKFYSFTDPRPNNTTLYYRVKQTDYNDEFSYSKIIPVTSCVRNDEVVIYPNPTATQFIISGDNIKDFQLFDALGSEKMNRSVKTEDDLKINVSELSEGIYYVRIGEKSYKLVKN